MPRRFLCALVLCCVLASSLLSAVGTVTVSVFNGVYTVNWTSNASGAVNTNSFAVRAGQIRQVKFVPASGGTQPSDLYDVTIVDADGVDLLNGMGANLSNAAPALITDVGISVVSPVSTATRLDVVVANAGNAKSGRVYIWVQ